MLIAAFPKLKACISPGIHLSIPSLGGVSDTSFFFFFCEKKEYYMRTKLNTTHLQTAVCKKF